MTSNLKLSSLLAALSSFLLFVFIYFSSTNGLYYFKISPFLSYFFPSSMDLSYFIFNLLIFNFFILIYAFLPLASWYVDLHQRSFLIRFQAVVINYIIIPFFGAGGSLLSARILYLEANYLDSIKIAPFITLIRKWSLPEKVHYAELYFDKLNFDYEKVKIITKKPDLLDNLLFSSTSMKDVERLCNEYLVALKALQEKGQLRPSSGSGLMDKLSDGVENLFISLFRAGGAIFEFALTHPYTFAAVMAGASVSCAYYYGLYQVVLDNILVTRASVDTLTKTVRDDQENLRQMMESMRTQIEDIQTLNGKIAAVSDSQQTIARSALNTLRLHDASLENMTEHFNNVEHSVKFLCDRTAQLEGMVRTVSDQLTPLEQLIILIKANPALVSHLATLTSEQHMAAVAAVARNITV